MSLDVDVDADTDGLEVDVPDAISFEDETVRYDLPDEFEAYRDQYMRSPIVFSLVNGFLQLQGCEVNRFAIAGVFHHYAGQNIGVRKRDLGIPLGEDP